MRTVYIEQKGGIALSRKRSKEKLIKIHIPTLELLIRRQTEGGKEK
jgi:hypothetical protein